VNENGQGRGHSALLRYAPNAVGRRKNEEEQVLWQLDSTSTVVVRRAAAASYAAATGVYVRKDRPHLPTALA